MLVSLIVAHDHNRVIGKDGKIPWHDKEDLDFFKSMTIGNAVIMGHTTYESIGKHLPHRLNIVISRNIGDRERQELEKQEIIVVRDVIGALVYCNMFEKHPFIIGGEAIYRQTLDQHLVDEIYVTLIPEINDGDRFFPLIPAGDKWEVEAAAGNKCRFRYRKIKIQTQSPLG